MKGISCWKVNIKIKNMQANATKEKKITNKILRPNFGFDDETMANYEMAVMI